MRVSTARRGLAARFRKALESGDLEEISRIADYVKAVGVALAGRKGEEDVDLASLTVSTEEAGHILGYHREHVRRLIRNALIKGEKERNQLRIPIWSIVAALEGRVPASARIRMADFSQWFHLVVRPKQEGEASA